jgi:hypothetical protein
MLAYTAVDGLRAISRNFDLDWQPAIGEQLSSPRPRWRTSFGEGQRPSRNALGILAALLTFGAAWLR